MLHTAAAVGDAPLIDPMLAEIVGIGGTVLILGAYLALQAGWLRADGAAYSLVNMAGALMVILSLTAAFNSAALILEIAWVLISLIGLYRLWRRRAHEPASVDAE